MKEKSMSGAELKLHFKQLCRGLKDNDEVTFGGGLLTFNRAKNRGPIQGPQSVDIEFNELFKVTYDPSTDD